MKTCALKRYKARRSKNPFCGQILYKSAVGPKNGVQKKIKKKDKIVNINFSAYYE